jgi:hypothetical protein
MMMMMMMMMIMMMMMMMMMMLLLQLLLLLLLFMLLLLLVVSSMVPYGAFFAPLTPHSFLISRTQGCEGLCAHAPALRLASPVQASQ